MVLDELYNASLDEPLDDALLVCRKRKRFQYALPHKNSGTKGVSSGQNGKGKISNQQGCETVRTWRYVMALITNTSRSHLGLDFCFSSAATTHISMAGSTMRSRMARQPSAAASRSSSVADRREASSPRDDSYTSRISRRIWTWSKIARGGVRFGSSSS